MKQKFQEQQFQIDAVKAVVDSFAGQPLMSKRFQMEQVSKLLKEVHSASIAQQKIEYTEDELEILIGYRNNPIRVTENQMLDNIRKIQQKNDIPISQNLQGVRGIKVGHNLTVEMETGTGKTYTYLRTMYELEKHYGWTKYIIIVPGIAIREGVYQAIQDTAGHFQELYGYKIRAFIYNSSRPQDIESFATDNKVSVMIINTQAFAARGKDARLIYQEQDRFQSRVPMEIIAQTNPILIIDEPQSVEGKTTQAKMQDFRPIATLRYSATHRNEYNKVYRLDALDAYNMHLVKKIQVKGINLRGGGGTSGYLYLEKVVLNKDRAPSALVEFEKRTAPGAVRKIRRNLTEGAKLFELSGGMPQYENCTIQDINGYLNKISVQGRDIYAGDAIGREDEGTLRRIQIRETIASHLEKERDLFDRGIKVLSLFFIDSVAKYRKYGEQGEELAGEYAQIFEEEYMAQVKELQSELYLSPAYRKFLERDNVADVHKGYFSIDKKGSKFIDPKVKRGSEDSDDISAYELIMKDKMRLLSREEPTRFIFSHSALKEGWDNPNVFQICALKQTGSETRLRQEVGRGMRLCINDQGIRQDFQTLGEAIHDINKLTIIASESYESFAKSLQKEIAASLKDRPQKANAEFFANQLVTDERGTEVRISEPMARQLNQILYKTEIIDLNDKITEYGRQVIEKGEIKLTDDLAPYRESVVKLLRSVVDGEVIKPENERSKVSVRLNGNFYKKEFRELWEKIAVKTIYEVRFDSDRLISDSIARIDSDLHVTQRTYELKSGELQTGTKEELEQGKLFKEGKRNLYVADVEIQTTVEFDLIGEIVSKTNLTRKTVAGILGNIQPEKFRMFKMNPEEFIGKVSNLINEVKAALVVNNIIYHKTEDTHDSTTIFSNTLSALRESDRLKKHIYDLLISDSETELKFAKNLENSEEVSIYAKLPSGFSITTPVSTYNPDWAIVFDEGRVRNIFFIAETKGSTSDMDLRTIEKLKIHCAGEHFKALSNDTNKITYAKVATYEDLLNIVEKK